MLRLNDYIKIRSLKKLTVADIGLSYINPGCSGSLQPSKRRYIKRLSLEQQTIAYIGLS